MSDYRIGSFTLPGKTLQARPIVVYFAKLPGGGDISGDIFQVIAAIEHDLIALQIDIDKRVLTEWVARLSAMAEVYATTFMAMDGSQFLYAQISNDFLRKEPLSFDDEEEFIEALGLPRSYGVG